MRSKAGSRRRLSGADSLGVVLAVVGVEAFNEYFDAREGTDRVFNPADLPPISVVVFWIGVGAFAGALAVGVYLTMRGGWPILAFALLGGAAAIFYEAPPIRWSYRGLGEAVIALSYGPWMVLGSLYLHTNGVSFGAFLASLVPGCLIMALAVANAIPDFHQDRLVGKRNLVVRLGRRRGVVLYLALAGAGLAVVPVGVAARVFAPCVPRWRSSPFRCSWPADVSRWARTNSRDVSWPRFAASSRATSRAPGSSSSGVLVGGAP